MQWDLGLQGIGVLAAMSLGFGAIAQLIVGRWITRWLWAIAAATYFVSGLLISEVWFGWATEAELQPNIDGLSFDEVLLIGLAIDDDRLRRLISQPQKHILDCTA